MAIVVDFVEVIMDEEDKDDDDCWDEVVVEEEDKDDDDDCSEEDIVAEDDSDDDGWDKEGTRKEIDMKAAATINNITATASTIRLINHNRRKVTSISVRK